jgi:hypothetical protein
VERVNCQLNGDVHCTFQVSPHERTQELVEHE